NTCLYTADAGEYKIIMTDTNYSLRSDIYDFNKWSHIKILVILSFGLVIIIILITNRFLTRKVFNSIVTPLDTLVCGVHQLRDGNLSHRIEYSGKDEFADVCTDFNTRGLLDLIDKLTAKSPRISPQRYKMSKNISVNPLIERVHGI
ncbi:MAG: HAMP domain-containing protein, partial [Oscillospiraceae bacterium]|nr:HAMP domain-containing protein [Oscillospiraceae bacterium]